MMQSQEHDLDSLAAFVEDRLDEAERERLMAHVADCAECRVTLAAMTRAHARPRAGRHLQFGLALAASLVLATFGWQWIAPPASTDGDETVTRRAAERIVDGKTFRLEEGVWIDRASDSASGLPTVTVQGAEDRAALLAQVPQLAVYADLGSRVVVVSDGKVYRFEP